MTLIIALIALNVAVPVFAVARSCVSRGGIEFNHILMFSIGYLFYWVLPIGIGTAHVLETAALMPLWYSIFDALPQETLAVYLIASLFCYLSFWFGSAWGQRQWAARGAGYRRIFFYPRLLDFFLGIGVVLGTVYALVLRDQLFRGYTSTAAEAGDLNRGSFIAVSLLLLSLAFIHSIKRSESAEAVPSVRAMFLNRYFLVYFFFAFLVLSLGGRLYFVSSLVMLMIYRSSYWRQIPGRTVAFVLVALVTLAGIAGTVRLNTSLDFQTVALGLIAEPLYTSISLLHFLQVNTIEALRFPIFLISAFLNLLPTALFPAKTALQISPKDYGFTILSPLGAQHSFVTFMINFGLLGTFAFLFLLGWYLSYLRYRDRDLLHRVFYVMLTGWLGFTFFRDDFSISLVKSMFEFSILVPGLVVIALQLVSVSIRAGAGYGGARAASTEQD